MYCIKVNRFDYRFKTQDYFIFYDVSYLTFHRMRLKFVFYNAFTDYKSTWNIGSTRDETGCGTDCLILSKGSHCHQFNAIIKHFDTYFVYFLRRLNSKMSEYLLMMINVITYFEQNGFILFYRLIFIQVYIMI